MKSFLLIISILLCHYPLGLFKDTIRRYDRMKDYGKNFWYDCKNAITPTEPNPITRFPGFWGASFTSYIFALFPMFKLFNIHWIFIIAINIMISLIIAPMLAFITIPFMTIPSKRLLKKITYATIIMGIILYGLAIVI